MAAVKVHGVKGSPFNVRVEVALQLKGVKYEFVEEDLTNKSPELLKYNPVYKKIPVLLHNGLPLPESLVILEYIDDVWSQYPLLPRDPYKKAQALFWSKFIDDKLITSVFKGIVGKEEKELEEAEENLKLLEKELKEGGKKFFGGEKIGFVDIVANFVAFWLGLLEEATGKVIFTKEKYPQLHQWSLDFNSVDVVKANLPDREKLLAFFIARFGSPKS